jgi:uncharacterized protein YndB with AHSA1/START domain
MSTVRQWVVVEAPPEEVWRVVADPRNLPRWNRSIRSVEGVPEDGLKPGDRYTTIMGALGVTFRVEARVEEIDPPRFARIRLSGPVEATVRTWVRPIGTSRSRLEHEIEYRLRGGPIGEVIARGLQLVGAPTLLKRGIRAQKKHVEGH